ncbi:MAG TPA: alternative ribosome rescue aminoacyl-tRNA hydrolase ArfB, partial [Ramlibacter sp.]
SLPERVKERLLATADQRLNKQGVLVIKAQASRSQEQNKAAAMERLNELVEEAARPVVPRKPTKPTYGSKLRRLESKAQRSSVKAGRGKVQD